MAQPDIGGSFNRGQRGNGAGELMRGVMQLARVGLEVQRDKEKRAHRLYMREQAKQQTAYAMEVRNIGLEERKAKLGKRPYERGADGFLYYTDGDKERVLPDVQGKAAKQQLDIWGNPIGGGFPALPTQFGSTEVGDVSQAGMANPLAEALSDYADKRFLAHGDTPSEQQIHPLQALLQALQGGNNQSDNSGIPLMVP